MTKLLLRRLLISIPLVLISSAAIFVLMSFVPGDPARAILGDKATPEAVANLTKQLGLDKPAWQQYLDWLWGVLHGDFGTSIFSGESVLKLITMRLGVTFSIMLGRTIAVAVFGIILGLISAIKEGWLGRSLDALSLVGFALPAFFVAIVLVGVFAVAWPIFPATGYVPIEVSPVGWFRSLVLPITAIALGGITVVAKQMRDSARTAQGRDYVRVLRSTGISERRILFVHVLRNAAVPTTTLIGLTAVGALGGAVFIENVFVLPGLGSLVTSATLRHDLPVLLGVAVAFTLIIIGINFVVDIVYGLLNPKARRA
jgi:peptide/nickel transport system permease protein